MVRANRAVATVLAGAVMALFLASGCGLLKPKKKGQFNEACTQDLDCESMACSEYGSICTKDCTYDKDCGGDLVCRGKDTGAGDACAKSVGNPPNGSCMNATECANGHCLKRIGQEDQPGICSKNCESGDDCPAGMKICESISDSGLIKMCLPGDPTTPQTARPQFNPAPPKPKGPNAVNLPRPVVTTQPRPTITSTTPPPPTTAATTPPPTATTKTTGPTVGTSKPPPPPPKKGH